MISERWMIVNFLSGKQSNQLWYFDINVFTDCLCNDERTHHIDINTCIKKYLTFFKWIVILTFISARKSTQEWPRPPPPHLLLPPGCTWIYNYTRQLNRKKSKIVLKIVLFRAFYSNIAHALAKKWTHEVILPFLAWILILSHNKIHIKVSENSNKTFSDTHPPLSFVNYLPAEKLWSFI